MYTWNITTRLIYREASTCLSFFSFLFNHTFFPMSLFCLAQQERINASLERTNPGITIKRAIAQNRLRLREWKLGEQDNKQTPTRKRAVWGRPRQKVKEKTHESIKGDQPSSLLHPPFKKKTPNARYQSPGDLESASSPPPVGFKCTKAPFRMLQETAFACSVLTEISKLCIQKLIQSRFRPQPLR